jgi:hypothetical protein
MLKNIEHAPFVCLALKNTPYLYIFVATAASCRTPSNPRLLTGQLPAALPS